MDPVDGADSPFCCSRALLSDADIEAVIAYLRSRPAAGERTVSPPDHFNLLGLIMLGAGMLPRGSPVFGGIITALPATLQVCAAAAWSRAPP